MYDFLPFISSLLCAPLPGALGVFLILRRQALMVDGLAHGLAPGMVLSHNIVGHTKGFSIIEVLLSGSFALGLSFFLNIIGDKLKEDKTSFMAVFSLISLSLVFFGMDHDHGELTTSLLTEISLKQFLGLLGIVCALCFGFFIYYPSMIGECFDEDFAKTHNIKSPFLFFVMLSLVLCSCVLGPILALSLMILPALSTKRIFMYYFSKNLDEKQKNSHIKYYYFDSINKFCLYSAFLSTFAVALGCFFGHVFSIVCILIIIYFLCLGFSFQRK